MRAPDVVGEATDGALYRSAAAALEQGFRYDAMLPFRH
jgi:hypothetical protein